jgi:hypothetical protein
MLKALLSAGNAEQNMHYPPRIYEAQYNAVTSWLIDSIVSVYPREQSLVDILNPFTKSEKVPVKGGAVEMPKDLRNFLGASVNVRPDYKAECCDDNVSQVDIKIEERKKGCLTRPVMIVDISEWDYRTTSSYKFPTHKNPIGCFFDDDKLRICPFDITGVEIRYVRQEKIYKYGYKMQPDDTYIFDPETTIESEWGSNAFKYLYRGLSVLYGIYTRENNFRSFAQELKQIGLT